MTNLAEIIAVCILYIMYINLERIGIMPYR